MKLLFIDGMNIAFRSFYGMPDLSSSSGFPTNAISGFLKTLFSLQDSQKPSHTAVFFDLGRSAHRSSLFQNYKNNRKDTPDKLLQQLPYIKQITQLLGFSLIEQQNVEADDLIASYATQLASPSTKILIVSSDKDLAQILSPHISQLLPPPTSNPKLPWKILTVDDVPSKFGVPASSIVDYLSLIGDSSDNIPGVPGVGPKTASSWIQSYLSINNILKNVNYLSPSRFQSILPQYIQTLHRNQQLISLQKNIPLQHNLLSPSPTKNIDALIHLLHSLDMHTAASSTSKRYPPSLF